MALRIMAGVLLLVILAMGGAPLELVLLLGAVFFAFVLVRKRVWLASERLLERFVPAAKEWHPLVQKGLLVVVFLAFLVLLKQVVYFALSLAGFDVQAMVNAWIAGRS